ncbi:hypothetical protein CYLTODRAFT_426331 [Cylindrobasidium torrendii FP15055 ss-10]|uniref:Uncharacterized protein n=1 Tax=Cylindrobasidium torrendii FP15055 ss-10 TaxID=1314674 RepID=A0A0D7AYW3_9AGAR|nr:hypothetical protein CYLTODRAFT_426331 [Cylindrobasidium torrendii FP15055 ss-10]
MLALLTIRLLALVSYARAQSAHCTRSEYDWAKNSKDQDPCAIGIAIGLVCDSNFDIVPIPPNSPSSYGYGGLEPTGTSDCICNKNYYWLISLCAKCQGFDGTPPWTRWNGNCTTTSDTFEHDVPDDTAIPHYAYLPLTSSSGIDIPAAQNDNGPETNASTTPGASSTSASSTPTNSSSGDSGGGRSHAGAIAGGVVGGVAGLAIVGGAIAYFLIRRRRRAREELNAPILDVDEPEVVEHKPNSAMSPAASSPEPMRLYNPDDPTTFPPPVSSQAPTSRRAGTPVPEL